MASLSAPLSVRVFRLSQMAGLVSLAGSRDDRDAVLAYRCLHGKCR